MIEINNMKLFKCQRVLRIVNITNKIYKIKYSSAKPYN